MKQIVIAGLLLATAFTACKKDKTEAPPKPQPTIENIEIGLANNEIGVIGKDFHFNADILAGDKIEDVQVQIRQKAGETYAKPWSFEITWDQYKDAKNANVHKHFDIPADAVEGKYDFVIIVNDQNGTKLEVVKNIAIYEEANLPVNPVLSIFNVSKNWQFFYRNEVFTTPGANFKKGDTLVAQASFTGIKGAGRLYILLIDKKHNHRPESIDRIDFSKVIVYDVYEHPDMATVGSFSNVVFDPATFTIIRQRPVLKIGAEKDNNQPVAGTPTWEPGNYYFGVVYKNTTYNMSFYKYIEFAIDYN